MSQPNRPSLRERMAQQLASIPEQPFDPEDDKKHQTLGPTLQAKRLAAATPIKAVRLEPIANLRFRPGYERDPSEFERPDFQELIDSIKQDGINSSPIDVREVITTTDAYFEVLAGERRTRALMKIGAPDALIAIRDCNDLVADRIHELENRHRVGKAVYSRAKQYVSMVGRYSSQKDLAANLDLNPGNLSSLLSLVTKAPAGMWEKVEDPRAIVWGDVAALLRAYEAEDFKRFVAHSSRVKARALVAAARKANKKPDGDRTIEREIFDRKRGDRFFVQLPKEITDADRAKVVDMVRAYFRESGKF